MANSEFSSLVTESHRFRDDFPQHDRWATLVNERQVHSLPSILATSNAAELVISFLQSDSDHNLLWLSNSFCICMNDQLDQWDAEQEDEEEDEESIRYIMTIFFKAPTNEHHCWFVLYGVPSADSSSLVPVVDALCQLLAWHKTLSDVYFVVADEYRTFESLPVSVPALETLVGQAKSPRTLGCTGYDSLSAEQCRVLAFGCNENIKLIVRDQQWLQHLSFLTEALTLNQSPKRLLINPLMSVPEDLFNAFLAAFENNTSLLELGFDSWRLDSEDAPNRVALIRAIGTNRGLQCLNLGGARLPDREWKVLWKDALSRHPTIRTVNVSNTLPRESRESSIDKQRRDAVVARSVRTNKVLTEINYTEDEHSPHTMREEVLPILQLNRFRPLVEAIKQEEDKALRCRLFSMTLLHDEVCSRPPFRYLLLSENPDLLIQCIRTPQELLRRRYYQLMEQLYAVVGDMEDRGMDLPSLVADSARIIHKRKR